MNHLPQHHFSLSPTMAPAHHDTSPKTAQKQPEECDKELKMSIRPQIQKWLSYRMMIHGCRCWRWWPWGGFTLSETMFWWVLLFRHHPHRYWIQSFHEKRVFSQWSVSFTSSVSGVMLEPVAERLAQVPSPLRPLPLRLHFPRVSAELPFFSQGADKCVACSNLQDGPYCMSSCPTGVNDGQRRLIFKYPNREGHCEPCHLNCTQG